MKYFVYPLSGIRKEAADPRVGYDTAYDYDPAYVPGGIAHWPITARRPVGRVSTPAYGSFANWLAGTSFGGALPNRDAIQEKLKRRMGEAVKRWRERDFQRRLAQHEEQYPIAYTQGYMRDLGRSLDDATGRGVDLAKGKVRDAINSAGRSVFNAANRGAGWLNPRIKSAIKKVDSFAR